MVPWFKRDRRKRYRVEPESLGAVAVSLIASSRKSVHGKLINMSVDGSAVFFPANECPELTTDQRVKLKFVIAPSKHSTVITATVKDLCTAGENKLCRFQFEESADFIQELDPAFWEYFNRREGVRVKPNAVEPIKVMLEWHSGFAQGQIIDISTTGMGLEVAPELGGALRHGQRLKLSFHLPGSEIPLKLVGNIIYNQPKGNDFQCGIRFEWDWSKTAKFELQESVIGAYLMRRQREIGGEPLRKKKG
jgi:hypothetical protein